MSKPVMSPAVLVIADDLKLVQALRGAFGSACQVFLSPSVDSGLKRVADEHLSAVLINLQTPGLNPEAAVAAIRNAHPDVTLLGFTTAANVEGLDGCQVVHSPADWKDLRTLLEGRIAIHTSTTPPPLIPGLPPVPALPVTPADVPNALQLALHEVAEKARVVHEPPVSKPVQPAETVPAALSPAAVKVSIPEPAPPPAPEIAPARPAAAPSEPDTALPATFLRDEALQLEQGNRFEASNQADGLQIAGRILRVSPHYVVSEVLNPQQVLPPGWQADEAVIYLARNEAYRGPARLAKVVDTGRSLIGEWALQGKWRMVSPASSASVMPDQQALAPFFERMRIMQRISEVFKAAVADVASVLEEARLCLDRVEISLPVLPGKSRPESLRAVLPELQKGMFPAFDQVFARFEEASRHIPPELDAEYHSLVRQYLHPLMMCAPFIHHIYSKPLGFAGDYGALQKLIGDPFEGQTLFAKLVNAWLVQCPAGDAYRHRLQLLVDELRGQAARCHAQGQDLRVLSIGCGAANEVVRFMESDDLSNSADFTLVDFNPDTLAYARTQIAQARQMNWRLTRTRTVQMPVQGIVLDQARMKRKGLASLGPVARAGGYDFIHCTGLFDYFSDRVCRRLLGAMHDMLAPGGSLVVCNFTPANPIRWFMKYILDWNLIHRTPEQLAALAPVGAAVRLTQSPAGVESYLHLERAI